MGFWDDVNNALEQAREARTADELVTALNRWHPPSSGDAFFAGSGGDGALIDALRASGQWKLHAIEADYHWQALSLVDGSSIEYVEGDVYRR